MATSRPQGYIPDPPPDAASPALRSFLANELERISVLVNDLLDTTLTLVRLRVLTGVSLKYNWDDSGITQADPGAGFIRANAANLGNASILWVSKTDANGRYIDYLDQPSRLDGRALVLQGVTSAANIIGTIGTVTDNNTYITVPFTQTSGAGNPAQGDLMDLLWYPLVEFE